MYSHISKRMHSLTESPTSQSSYIRTWNGIVEMKNCNPRLRFRNYIFSFNLLWDICETSFESKSCLRFAVSPRAITACFAGGRFRPFGLKVELLGQARTARTKLSTIREAWNLKGHSDAKLRGLWRSHSTLLSTSYFLSIAGGACLRRTQ